MSTSHIDAMHEAYTPMREELSMARVRGRQRGYLRREGPSWFVTFHEYRKDPDTGEWTKPERVTEWLGPESMTRKEATAKAQPFLDKANRQAERPSMAMTVSAFLETRFMPMVERTKKWAGQKHYRSMLKLIEPAIGLKQIAAVTTDDIDSLVIKLHRKGYSRQTQLHVKNAVSAIFNHAASLNLYDHRNPAAAVQIGEIVAQKRPTYTAEQLAQVLIRLDSPIYEMALLGAACSLGPAELLGIRIRHCNLAALPVELDGEVIAPRSILIAENFYDGHRDTLKTRARRRIVPLDETLAARLAGVIAAAKDPSSEAPLFQSRNGTPLDAHNISNRVFKRLSADLGFPVAWYGFRRAHSSLAALTGANVQDRKLVMGHSREAMSLYYDVADVERMRAVPARIMERVRVQEEAARAAGKLTVMERKAG